MNGRTLDSYFDETAQRVPQRPALCIGSAIWTYAELLREKQSVADMLRRQKLGGAGRVVGVLCEKSLAAFAGLLGIMASGNTYLPLSPRFPDQRLLQVAQDADLAGLIVDCRSAPRGTKLIAQLQQGFALSYPEGDVVAEAGPRDSPGDAALAYLLYTSGSTGTPKGVPVTHGNAAAFLEAMTSVVRFSEGDRFTQFCELAFDFSIGEIFLCWRAGGCLYVPSFPELMMPIEFVSRHRLTVWSSVPTVANNLCRLRALRPGTFPSLRLSMFCGEVLPTSLAKAWLAAAQSSELVNLYGPTEATVFATAYHYDRSNPPKTAAVPLGAPFPGIDIRVARRGNDPTVGELLLSGPQVVPGYWRNDRATERAFVRLSDDACDRLWYCTGDLVSLDARYGLLFHGRCDDQVKVRGHRVQLAEIESVLRQLTQGAMVAAVPAQVDNGTCDSIVVFCSTADCDEQALLASCRALLPDYMVPSRILRLEPLPLNHNGKIDYGQLSLRAAACRQEGDRMPAELSKEAARRGRHGLELP